MKKALFGIALILLAGAFLLIHFATKEASTTEQIDDEIQRIVIHVPRATINFTNIRLLQCVDAAGNTARGTAFFINKDTLVTAAHVVENRMCVDAVTLATVTEEYLSREKDFALMKTTDIAIFDIPEITCEGYKTGERYDAVGYAGGVRLLLNRLTATKDFTADDHDIRGEPAGHLRILDGDVISGMSGGPIFDQDGKVVGINSATNHLLGIGMSRSLSDTILCREPSD